MNNWIKDLEEKLAAQGNAADAFWMSKYMRNQFTFLGVKKPAQVAIFKEHLRLLPKEADYLALATEMADCTPHELHYLAMVLVCKMHKKWDSRIPIWVENMAKKHPWWDITDVLAPKILGPYFLKFPEERSRYIQKWMSSDDIWLQRLCLLYALDYKEKTNTNDLAAIIQALASSKEFFIQKAIGWVLRQYARTNPSWVRSFVQNNSLAALSKREAMKWLK